MSDSENQGATWGQWYPRIRDDDFIRARYSETHLGNSEYQHLDADYLNALEATITTLKAQLAAAEGRAGVAATMAGFLTSLRDDPWEVEPMVIQRSRELLLEYADALSAPASDTGNEEGS